MLLAEGVLGVVTWMDSGVAHKEGESLLTMELSRLFFSQTRGWTVGVEEIFGNEVSGWELLSFLVCSPSLLIPLLIFESPLCCDGGLVFFYREELRRMGGNRGQALGQRTPVACVMEVVL